MPFPFCSKNGVLIPSTQAVLPVTNTELVYGFGVYENIRVTHGHPLFLCDHSERLLYSAQVVGLKHAYSVKSINEHVFVLLKQLAPDAINIKMLLIGGKTSNDATLWIMPLAPLFPDKRLYRDGALAMTVAYERYLPQAKTLNMLGSYLAFRQAKSLGAYDALLLNRNGSVTEGTRTNFFAVGDRTIFHAPRSDILEGVTMKYVLQTAKSLGFSIEEKFLNLEEIQQMDGAFLTSTSSKIMPITRIDNLTFVIPDALKTLMKAFDNFLSETFTQCSSSTSPTT